MKSLTFVVGMTIFSAALIMAFEPPTDKERLSAIGSTDELPDSLQLALTIDDFEPIPDSRPGDWLAEHHENGQTMEDLYPDPHWNFVFGQASLRDRVGVISFARYDPVFYGESRGSQYHQLFQWRSAKVLVHETAHMFSLAHCIYFKCVMNGSNHLQESDSRPMSLCPVCLRKLQSSILFDVVARYHLLRQFCSNVGFVDERDWVTRRLKKIEDFTYEQD